MTRRHSIRKSEKKCSVVRCDQKHYGLGYCDKHYKRLKKHGEVVNGRTKVTRPRKVCSINDCDKTVTTKGFCEKHYRRFLRHGDPLAEYPSKDITGERFGRWTAMKRGRRAEKDGHWYWVVKCDCGVMKEVLKRSLTQGTSQSCGCLRQELVRTRNKPRPGATAEQWNIYQRYRAGAEQRDILFNLLIGDFVELIQKDCFYCGSPPMTEKKPDGNLANPRESFFYNGLDRIVSSNGNGGYTLDNVVPCCPSCNFSKHVKTQSEFYAWVETVHGHLCKKGLIKEEMV